MSPSFQCRPWIPFLAMLLGTIMLVGCATIKQSNDAPLIPRAELFKQQTTFLHTLNSSGKKLAYLDNTNTRKIMIKDMACPGCATTPDSIDMPESSSPFMFFWTQNEDRMVVAYFSPAKKRMDVTVYNFTTKQFTSLFPENDVTSFYSFASAINFYAQPHTIFKVSEKGQSDRYFKIDFAKGERIPLAVKGNYLQVELINDGTIGVSIQNKAGIQEWVFLRDHSKPLPLATLTPTDQWHYSGFLTSYLDERQVAHALFLDSSTSDTLAITDVEIPTGKKTFIAKDKADIQHVFVPANGKVQAYVQNYLKPEWRVNDPSVAKDISFLTSQPFPLSGIWSRSQDDQRWLVTHLTNSGQEVISVYDRHPQTLNRIMLPNAPAPLHHLPLQIRAEVVHARDKTPLITYLTMPAKRKCQHSDCPMVVYVHGGPHSRDEYPSTPVIAWLADRGYAVLTVNYRGSSGFGKSFEAMSKGQWGLAMQDDVLDAIDWAVRTNVPDPKRIAIMGASHGGFLTLNSITVAPDRFACAVASGATGNLASFVEKVTTSQPWLKNDLFQSVGDTGIPHVKAELTARSPISKVAAVTAPILITHGGQDQQSPLSDAVDFALALKANDKKVALVVFPEEGHGINNTETKLAYYGIVESFLAACLGGRKEPISFSGDSKKIDIKLGENLYPFLRQTQ